jgi:ankyrin repeat protein
VFSVAFSHDDSKLVSGSYDSSIKVWDATQGNCLLTLTGHSSIVYSVAFSHDDSKLVSGSRDNSIKVWDALASVAFSYDDSQLVKSDDMSIKVKDALAVLLHRAVLDSDIVAVNNLLAKKADMNLQDKVPSNSVCLHSLQPPPLTRTCFQDGNTLLHRAVMRKNVDAVTLLLERMADVNLQHKVPSSFVCFHSLQPPPLSTKIYFQDGKTPLHRAVMHKNVDAVTLLLKSKADVNLQDKVPSSSVCLLHFNHSPV